MTERRGPSLAWIDCLIVGAVIGAFVVVVFLIVIERLFFPEVHEAASREWMGAMGWPWVVVCFGALVGVPLGGLLGWYLGRPSGNGRSATGS